MSDAAYGQRGAMEDPTMVGTLQAQIEMIWPLERPVLERLGLAEATRVADLGCGTGRFLVELAKAWPAMALHGFDLFAPYLERARADLPEGRATLTQGDARATGVPDESFDAVCLRHILHALGDREALLAEAHRLLRPGGLCYVLAEDYQGLLTDTECPEAQRLFHDAAPAVLPTGTDLMHGRRAFGELIDAGFVDVRVDPIVVDTCNTPREVLARMMRWWRDGYAAFIAEHMTVDPATIEARFDDVIAAYEDPGRYACWLLFAVSGRKLP